MFPTPETRRRPRLPLALTFALALPFGAGLTACRQPSAELALPDEQATAEPAGRGAAVFVEAPEAGQQAPQLVLDWTAVDNSLASLVEGERYRVDYDAAHPWQGAATPLVTVVVFADYQCPYCARLDSSLSQLLARYPDDLRVVYRQFPLPMHKQADFASKVALAAHARGVFGLVHPWLYANNRQLDPSSVSAELQRIGVDAQLVLGEIDAGAWNERVAADMKVGSAFGVRGTPAFFVNGAPHSGAKPLKDLEGIVEAELAAAERLVAAGAPRREVWARVLAASSATGPAAKPQSQPSAPQPIATAQRFPTKVKGLPQRGAKKAKIELLVCSDFDCPYCARSVATVEQLLQNHPKELAVFFRHHPLPFHQNARAAHRAAVAAHNQGKFWEMYELLFANSKQRSDAELEDMAKQLGLDLKRFRKDVADPATDKLIDAQADYCKNDLSASGTPTFFINGRKLVGARPVSDFETVINEELSGSGPP